MAEFWVLVVDESCARFFETDKIKAELNEFETLTNPAARLQEQDLVTGKKGRSFDSRGENRHAMEPPTTAREQAAIRFAKTIAGHLKQGAGSSAYNRLILVAPPGMLGYLRQELDRKTRERVYHTISKNLVHSEPGELLKHLSQ